MTRLGVSTNPSLVGSSPAKAKRVFTASIASSGEGLEIGIAFLAKFFLLIINPLKQLYFTDFFITFNHYLLQVRD